MSPELRGEILALNLVTRNDHPQRIRRVIRKLNRLLADADELREAAVLTAGVP